MKSRLSSRFLYRLVLFLALIVTLSLSLAGYLINGMFVRATTPQIDAQIQLTGKAVSDGIEKWLQGHQAIVRNLDEDITLYGLGSVRDLLSRTTPASLFSPVYFGQPDGTFIREPLHKLPDGYDPRNRPWYKAAVASHDLVVINPYRSASTGKLVMTLAMRVEKDGQFLGVVGADLDLDTIKTFLASFDLGGLGQVFLVDADGIVLVHPDPRRILKPFAENFRIEDHLGGSIANAEGATYTAFHPLGAVNWYVGVSIDRGKALAPIASMRRLLITTMAVLIGLITPLLAVALHRLASRPITEITTAMAALSDGSDVAIPSLDREDEIGAMARALAVFKHNITEVQRLEREQFVQRDMVAMVAHDLQSPLAGIRALLRALPAGGNDEYLDEISRTCAHMHSEIGQLLQIFAARERELPPPAEIGAGALFERAAAVAASVAAEKRITLRIEESFDQVRTEPRAASGILDNFLSNALKYSPPGTVVTLRAEPLGDELRLCVIDQGPGIPPEEESALFQRFTPLSPRPTASEPSTGLGLYIARVQAERMGARVGYQPNPGGGSIFFLALPVTVPA
jgi:signal transduction histidine kinase